MKVVEGIIEFVTVGVAQAEQSRVGSGIGEDVYSHRALALTCVGHHPAMAGVDNVHDDWIDKPAQQLQARN